MAILSLVQEKLQNTFFSAKIYYYKLIRFKFKIYSAVFYQIRICKCIKFRKLQLLSSLSSANIYGVSIQTREFAWESEPRLQRAYTRVHATTKR